MSRFKDKLCPICRTTFRDDEDIVVCPDCGTPHHRACYMQLKKCGVAEYHADGFVWKGSLPDQTDERPNDAVPSQVEESAPDISATQTTDSASQHSNSEIPEVEALRDFNPYFEMYKKIRELTDDEKRGEDGVSSKELCHFAGRSVVHYSQAFSAFRVGVHKNGQIQPVKAFLNLCAGFFAPIHQFYRRMDILAIALLLLSAVTSLPEILLLYDEQYTAIAFSEHTLAMLNKLGALCSFVNLAEMILLCVFGDYLYYKFCVRRIKKIRSAYDDGKAEGYYAALTESGMPSKLRIVIGLLASLLVIQFTAKLPALFLL